jgi:hypothetical protein
LNIAAVGEGTGLAGLGGAFGRQDAHALVVIYCAIRSISEATCMNA